MCRILNGTHKMNLDTVIIDKELCMRFVTLLRYAMGLQETKYVVVLATHQATQTIRPPLYIP